MHPTRFRAYFRSTRSLIAGLTALAAVPASAPALMAQAATPPAAATTPAVAKAASAGWWMVVRRTPDSAAIRVRSGR